jgi:hypothetical protein
MLNILQTYFTDTKRNDEQILRFIENIQIIFTELTEETKFFDTNSQEIPFIYLLLHRYLNLFYHH